MNSHRKLLLLCVRGLSTYHPDKGGIDEHIASLLESGECADLNEGDCVFITEVLAGCTRFAKLIQVTVDAFYAMDGKTCLRADYNLFIVVSYLVMFRLEELGVSHVRKFIVSQDTVKMFKFLHFLFDEQHLKTWIHSEWCKVYDQSFVQTNLLAPMMRYLPEMTELIQQLKDMVDNKQNPRSSSSKNTTDPKPFNLTKPKPRNVPTPEKIPRLKVHKPAPKTTYQSPVEMEIVEKMRETAKKRAEVKYHEAERLKFTCATAEKSDKTKAVIQQIMQEREDREVFEPLKASSMPATLNDTVPIKMNAAAILREGARVQREEDEVLRKLAGLEAGEKDDSEYLQWQEEMKQKKAVEALAEIERKHLAGQLSYEEAIIARQSHFQETREIVKVLREESEQVMNRYFEEREEQKREMRQLVETITEGRENVKEARDKLQRMKQEMVQQVAKENRELMKQALEEAEEEMRKKTELIQQIRAMESVPVIRHKFVDITESSGHGLLLEMSIAELRERLALMNIAEQEEREQRRMEIAATKEAKDKMLVETLENISRHRKEKTKAAVESNVQKRQSMAKLLSSERDQKVAGLQQQLENKRRTRERLQQDNPVTRCQMKQPSAKLGTTAKWNEVKKSRSAAQLGSKKAPVPSSAGGNKSTAMTTLLRSTANV